MSVTSLFDTQHDLECGIIFVSGSVGTRRSRHPSDTLFCGTSMGMRMLRHHYRPSFSGISVEMIRMSWYPARTPREARQ